MCDWGLCTAPDCLIKAAKAMDSHSTVSLDSSFDTVYMV